MSSIRYIRKQVFGLSQADFAELVGVTQASVSRWENGGSPSLAEMALIREAAAKRRKRFRDAWFFEPPVDAPRAHTSAPARTSEAVAQ